MLTLAEANQAIAAPLARAQNMKIAVSVCDTEGRLVAFQRMDGAFSESVPLAIGKAIAGFPVESTHSSAASSPLPACGERWGRVLGKSCANSNGRPLAAAIATGGRRATLGRVRHDPFYGSGAAAALSAASQADIDFSGASRRSHVDYVAHVVVGDHIARTDDHGQTQFASSTSMRRRHQRISGGTRARGCVSRTLSSYSSYGDIWQKPPTPLTAAAHCSAEKKPQFTAPVV